MNAIDINQNALFTIKSAEILGVSPIAEHYAINAAYCAAMDAGIVVKHLLAMARDWLSMRSVMQRKADVRTYEVAGYAALPEQTEIAAIKRAVEEAKRHAASLVRMYPVFAGCNIVTHQAGRAVSVRAPGVLSGILA
ncbi:MULTISPECIES: hypothetical protein [Acidithiobacillus]|uniref:Uncharacterized protein n=2 Tax=Acidithiobacillus TaxID=119977 RepID=A0A179B7C0_ACIFR|nr:MULTISPECIES: hypothetical protein [Acidithiobacillus]MEB8487618.1 hypothetical protein [Acidithiobacillus ferriphilus]MEB8488944.1 hypothetical protein [Acidithiobacillus ferriphilus]MEB8494706.1 hypothetical protein [Acidithiobacillus ferriphilus]MEB8515175.1 hypothetical protein [Acidithiobacillus ferriphilus]MEB8522101.1 hypothetical protein [Acidithiobacillus ferriphilus]